MRRQKGKENYIAEWNQEYDKQHTPDMQKKREEIRDLINKAYREKTEQINKSPIWKANYQFRKMRK